MEIPITACCIPAVVGAIIIIISVSIITFFEFVKLAVAAVFQLAIMIAAIPVERIAVLAPFAIVVYAVSAFFDSAGIRTAITHNHVAVVALLAQSCLDNPVSAIFKHAIIASIPCNMIAIIALFIAAVIKYIAITADCDVAISGAAVIVAQVSVITLFPLIIELAVSAGRDEAEFVAGVAWIKVTVVTLLIAFYTAIAAYY
jgi:hypothetical protein